MTRHAKETGLATSLIIRCARGNAASRRVAERAGYTKVGIQPASEPLGDGELADLVLYSSSVVLLNAVLLSRGGAASGWRACCGKICG